MAVPDPIGPETVAAKAQPAIQANVLARRGGEKGKQPVFYGGQAVIEGVMMRGKTHYAVAVRLPTTKEIVIDRGELTAPSTRRSMPSSQDGRSTWLRFAARAPCTRGAAPDFCLSYSSSASSSSAWSRFFIPTCSGS